MATRNFRVGELEIKPNYTSLVRAYNYDSRFYLNDKDAPSEDVESTDWAPDPTKLYSGCSLIPGGVMYRMGIIYESAVWNATTDWINISSSCIVPQNTQDELSPSTIRRNNIVAIGTTSKLASINYEVLISYMKPSSALGQYIAASTVSLCMPYYLAAYNATGMTGCTMGVDTTRGFSNGSTGYPGWMIWMQQTGYQSWNQPGTWIKGMDPCYQPAYIGYGGAGPPPWRPIQQRPRIPNEQDYYWLFISIGNWFYGNQLNYTAQYRGASARITARTFF